VAARHPRRLLEVHAAGHEVACHGELHLRAGDRSRAAYRRDLETARRRLEDATGAAVRGHRAPEWSLRCPEHPHLRVVAEAGFTYDSSLAPCLGSGRLSNPRAPYLLRWFGASLVEAPPLTFAGRLQLPACGWTGRLAGPRVVLAAARRAFADGGLPVLTVHPWETTGDPTPGELTGLARFLHDTARAAFARSLPEILGGAPWTTLADALGAAFASARAASEITATAQLTPAAPGRASGSA
jgi:peptidoglycan/xylan/chitin deacetylase (PgdA/CDA1 family)